MSWGSRKVHRGRRGRGTEQFTEAGRHIDAVTSPDSVFVIPTHDSAPFSPAPEFASCIHAQLKHDPLLVELDNALHVDMTQLRAVSWTELVVITGCLAAVPLDDHHLTPVTLMNRFGDAEVRTGNRSTLVENGFTDSKLMALCNAMEPEGYWQGSRTQPRCLQPCERAAGLVASRTRVAHGRLPVRASFAGERAGEQEVYDVPRR